MTYPESIVRQNDAARFGQSGTVNLPALIEKYRHSSSADVRSLTRAAEAVMYAAQDLQWCSRRYCDGRSSYAPGMHNGHTRTLLGLGVELNATGDGTLYAADGGFGPPPEGMGDEWSSYQNERRALLEMVERLRLRAEKAEKALKHYAEIKHYDTAGRVWTGNPDEDMPHQVDMGEIARAALAVKP